MTKEEIRIYDKIVEYEVATNEELNLVRQLMDGTWTELLNSVIYARTGYQNIYQYEDYINNNI